MNYTPVEKLTGEELFTAFNWVLSALTITDVDRRNAIVAEVKRRLTLTAPPPSPPVEELLALQRLGVEDGFTGDEQKPYPRGDIKASIYEQGLKLGCQLYQASLKEKLTKEAGANPSAPHFTESELKRLRELAAGKEDPTTAGSNQAAQVTVGLLDEMMHGVIACYEQEQASLKTGSTPRDCAYNIGLVLGEYLWRNCSGCLVGRPDIDSVTADLNAHDRPPLPSPATATNPPAVVSPDKPSSPARAETQVVFIEVNNDYYADQHEARVVPVSALHGLLISGGLSNVISRIQEAPPYTWFRDHLIAAGNQVIILKLPTPPAPGVSVDVEIAEVVTGSSLEDYNYKTLTDELWRRFDVVENNCCPYCGVALDSTSHSCKLAGSRDKMTAYCSHPRLMVYQPPKLVQDLDTREKIRAALDAIQPHQAVVVEETATDEIPVADRDNLSPAQYLQLIREEAKWYKGGGESDRRHHDALMAVAARIPPG